MSTGMEYLARKARRVAVTRMTQALLTHACHVTHHQVRVSRGALASRFQALYHHPTTVSALQASRVNWLSLFLAN